MKMLSIVFLLVPLSACGLQKVYSKPNITNAQASQDLKQCKYDAHKAVQIIACPADPAEGSLFRGDEQARLTRECMEAKGYETLINPDPSHAQTGPRQGLVRDDP